MAVGFFLIAIVYAIVVVLASRAFVWPHVAAGHNEVLLTVCQIAGTIYAVLLGFLVVVVWQSYDGAHTNLANEASMLTTLYRQTDGLGSTERVVLRHDLRVYTHAVIDNEWAVQAVSGGASSSARHAIDDMYRVFSTLPPVEAQSTINDDFVQNLSTVAIERNNRTLRAGEALPWILWIGLTLGGAVVVGLSALPRMENVWLHIVACALLAALIGTLLGIAAVLDRPFNGPMALASTPFAHALQVFDSVDRGS